MSDNTHAAVLAKLGVLCCVCNKEVMVAHDVPVCQSCMANRELWAVFGSVIRHRVEEHVKAHG